MKMKWMFVFAALAFVAASSHAATNDKVFRLALAAEPPNLNSTKATDQVSGFVLGHVFEGLTRFDEKGAVVGGVATDWKIGPKEATFNLRSDAKWSDGKPVTAKDFVNAWRLVVDPKTASEYAFIVYYIKNAEAINTGKMDPKELGVVAVNDNTLKVTFEKPCGFFPSLVTFPTFFPLREDISSKYKDKYAADADKMVYNGPFVLTSWVHGASLKMDKNQNYWNKANVQIDQVDIPYITPDDSARFNFFKDKKTDYYSLGGKDDLPKAQKERYRLRSHLDGSIFYLEFNHRQGRVTDNKNIRKAIGAVFNPKEYVEKVIGIPGTKEGCCLVPGWLKGVKKGFRQEYSLPKFKQDIPKAKEYLAKGLKELKMDKLPPIVWLTGDSPTSAREAEYFQELLKKTLGIDLKIDKQIFKQRLAKMTAGEFDIVSAGWGPDYADPMTFADLWTSWNENNRGRYKSAKYDEYIRKAQSSADQKVRMDAMAAAEKVGIDDLVVLPMYERAIMYVMDEKVTGLVRRAVGPDPDLTAVKLMKK